MDSKNTMQFWNGLPTWAKGVVAVGGLAAVYFGVRSFLNKLKADANMKDQLATQQSQENQLQDNIDNGIRPTYDVSQYRQWADELQSQFDGCDWVPKVPLIPANFLGLTNWSGSGSKVGAILFHLKNDSDFLSLSTSWGASRTYDQCGYFTGDFSGNLAQAITDELDQEEINALNNYLLSKGITYKL
jgi:hypothetical protein